MRISAPSSPYAEPRVVAADGGHAISGLIERCLVVFALLLFMEAFIGLWQVGRLDLEQSPTSPLFQALSGLVYAAIAPLALLNLPRFIALARRHPEPFLLAVLAMASAAWSADPLISLRRGTALLGTTVFAAYLALRFDERQLLRLLLVATAAAALGSFAAVAALPETAVHRGDLHDGAWRGVFFHKNLLGPAMALAACLLIQLGLRPALVAALALPTVAAATALVWQSTSKTALALQGMVLAALAVAAAPVLHPRLRIAILVVVALVGGALVLQDPELGVGTVGGDRTFTGRTEIWAAAWEIGWDKPWLGWGYRAFWSQGGPAQPVIAALGYFPPHGHNGALDAWLELGLVGLVLLVVAYARCIAWVARACQDPAQAWRGRVHATTIAALTVTALTTSTVLAQNNIFWLLFLVACFRAGAARGEGAA